MDANINIALGNGDTNERLQALMMILAKQEQILQQLGPTNPLVTPQQFSNTLRKIVELSGFKDSSSYFQNIPADKPILLAWHEPDTFDFYSDPRIALQLSGHTHGGQICAPVVGPLLLPEYGRKYPYGLYRRGTANLFVTRGIGTLTIPARFLCAPEVAILSLKL
jgi:predicted MPP superfamily phosphohydrolase